MIRGCCVRAEGYAGIKGGRAEAPVVWRRRAELILRGFGMREQVA